MARRETDGNLIRGKITPHQVKATNHQISSQTMVRLVQQLDGISLAIIQAAAYINQRKHRVMVSH